MWQIVFQQPETFITNWILVRQLGERQLTKESYEKAFWSFDDWYRADRAKRWDTIQFFCTNKPSMLYVQQIGCT